jgi:hypothetical protein
MTATPAGTTNFRLIRMATSSVDELRAPTVAGTPVGRLTRSASRQEADRS